MSVIFATSIARIISKAGVPVTYTSMGAMTRNSDLSSSVAKTNYSLKVHFKMARDTQLNGNVSDMHRECRIAGHGLKFTPKRGDSIDDGTNVFTVGDVDTRVYNGVVLEHILKVVGNAKI